MPTELAQPIVSVVVPCYNAEKFVEDAVHSVLCQSLANIELIVVDDGSTDATPERVRRVNDPRLRYLRQQNAGVSAARNLGISEARGAYVAFLDADDLYMPDNLAKKAEYLEAHPENDVVYSSVTIFDSASGRELGQAVGRSGPVLRDLLELRPGVVHSPSAVVVRREALQRVGGFDLRLSTSADWDLWIRLAANGDFGYINEPLVRYRRHPQQMHRNIQLMASDSVHVLRKARSAGLFADDRHARYCEAKLYLVVALSFLRASGDRLRFAKFFVKSLATSTRPIRERIAGS